MTKVGGEAEGSCCCCSDFLTKAAASGEHCVRSQSSSCARLCLRHWHPLCFKIDYRLILFFFFIANKNIYTVSRAVTVQVFPLRSSWLPVNLSMVSVERPSNKVLEITPK